MIVVQFVLGRKVIFSIQSIAYKRRLTVISNCSLSASVFTTEFFFYPASNERKNGAMRKKNYLAYKSRQTSLYTLTFRQQMKVVFTFPFLVPIQCWFLFIKLSVNVSTLFWGKGWLGKMSYDFSTQNDLSLGTILLSVPRTFVSHYCNPKWQCWLCRFPVMIWKQRVH